ncbi:hypothetical protein [Cupriavidus sp. DL-D2]|uniref:hypothetical protein n=1 Tax=Cupriavidus sp. DL-D2 TaxID=3144974 RepID=UPI003214D409
MDPTDYSIPENWDRIYILDAAARPVRVFDFRVHSKWACTTGKQYKLRDTLPEHGVEVTTYFSGWASLRDDKPPMFWTLIRGGGHDRMFESETWEAAQDKHRRVVEKVRRVLPRIG